MKQFRSKITGAILTPSSDMVVEQMEKSPDFEVVDPTAQSGQGQTNDDGSVTAAALKKMNVEKLTDYAVNLGITVPEGAKKGDIIDLILTAQSGHGQDQD